MDIGQTIVNVCMPRAMLASPFVVVVLVLTNNKFTNKNVEHKNLNWSCTCRSTNFMINETVKLKYTLLLESKNKIESSLQWT